jgi:methylated-DNA-[protein]-cysteine S-methyltransferase
MEIIAEMKIYKAYFNSPLGLLEVVATDNSICEVKYVEEKNPGKYESNNCTEDCVKQLHEYFNGGRKEFELNLQPEGTEFQKKVWDELLKIPYGYTKSYQFQAKMVGNVLSIRAVAKANGQNKIAIIIPCHRVIGSDGSLTGYAGGLWRKKWLLAHEQKYSDGEMQLELSL